MSDFEPGLFITMFSDASHCPKTHANGYGGWAKFGAKPETMRCGGKLSKSPNSTVAEYKGLVATLKKLEKQKDIVFKDKILIIQCDNQPALKTIERNYSGYFLRDLKLRHVKYKWVKAHNGYGDSRSAVNEWCDKEAKKHMRRMRDG
ncbi:ribonuclease H [Alteromonas phage vB_AmeP_PT11-V19]|nr:ribonuclease H [Alteromonas phage vB_AmeP_PT11-V19]